MASAEIEALKNSVIKIGSEGVYGYLLSQFPFFALPVIKTLTQYAINWLVTTLVNETELGVYFLYVDYETSAQAQKFKAAVASKDQDAIISAARDLIRLRQPA